MAISTETHYSSLACYTLGAEIGGFESDCPITLVSDKNWNISKAFNMLDEDEGLSKRGLVIINPNHVVVYWHEMGMGDRRDVRGILQVLKAVQSQFGKGNNVEPPTAIGIM